MNDDRRRVPTLLVTICAGIIMPLQIVAVSYLVSIEHRLTVLESSRQAQQSGERGGAHR